MKRALIVVCVFFVFHQVTGINVPFYYGPRVLAGFFRGPKSTAVMTGVPKTVVVMVGFSFFIASFAPSSCPRTKGLALEEVIEVFEQKAVA